MRRVVVAETVLADEQVPEVVLAPTGSRLTLLWAVDSASDLPGALPEGFLPRPGGWRVALLTFPPAGTPTPADGTVLPDLAERMRQGGGRGMHSTPTVDVVHVLSGRIGLELDDGETVELAAGDTVVQQGARHGWRPRGAEPATLLLFMAGTEKES